MKKVFVGIAALLCCAFVVVAAQAQSNLGATDDGSFQKPPPLPRTAEDGDFKAGSTVRQGGETCATATAITALPFEASGTTIDYIHDYDEVCPYADSTAPDVVYSFAPAADVIVDASLCSPGTNTDYDTKLFVYENACPDGLPFACNDDACSSPLYADYVSEITGLALTAGNTYYFVVDGYGGAAGDYTLSVSEGQPPPTCGSIGDPGFLLGQDTHGPSDGWSAATSCQASWATYILAETIDQAADPDWFDIGSLNVWGLSLVNTGTWAACDPTGMTFDVIFYEDNAGFPGTVICDMQSVVPTITPTGLQYSGFDLFQFDLPAACDLGSVGTKWFSVQSEPSPNDCGFLWMSGTGGDSQSLQDDGTGWAPTDYDRAMCINGATIPVELLSFGIE